MKTKAFIIVVILAVVTISFAFTSKEEATPARTSQEVSSSNKNEPSGGFIREDKM